MGKKASRIPGLQVASGTGVEYWVWLMMEGSRTYVKQNIITLSTDILSFPCICQTVSACFFSLLFLPSASSL